MARQTAYVSGDQLVIASYSRQCSGTDCPSCKHAVEELRRADVNHKHPLDTKPFASGMSRNDQEGQAP